MRRINPDIRVIAPWREWEFKSRTDLLAQQLTQLAEGLRGEIARAARQQGQAPEETRLDDDGTLPRSANNVIVLSFDSEIAVPVGGGTPLQIVPAEKGKRSSLKKMQSAAHGRPDVTALVESESM